jgi:hypothetical protein
MVSADNESSSSSYRVLTSGQLSSCSPYLSLTYTPNVVPTASTNAAMIASSVRVSDGAWHYVLLADAAGSQSPYLDGALDV